MIINSILGGGTELPSNMKIAKGSDFTWTYESLTDSFVANIGITLDNRDGYTSTVMCDMYETCVYARRNDQTIFNYTRSGYYGYVCIKDTQFGTDAEAFAEHIADMTIIYRTA